MEEELSLDDIIDEPAPPTKNKTKTVPAHYEDDVQYKVFDGIIQVEPAPEPAQ